MSIVFVLYITQLKTLIVFTSHNTPVSDDFKVSDLESVDVSLVDCNNCDIHYVNT